VDVGGQRNERKKWIHCFDDVKAIVFIESLAAYNQVLFEDGNKNRMIESLELFKDISNRPSFKDTPIFLFLNKKDLFEQEIRQVDLRKTFPNYDGGLDYDRALDFIAREFKAQGNGKEVTVKPLSASTRGEVKAAFDDMKRVLYESNRDTILQQVSVLRSEQSAVATTMKKEEEGSGCC